MSLIRVLVWAVAAVSAATLAFLPAALAGTWVADLTGGGSPVRLGAAMLLWTLLAVGLTIGLARVLLPATLPTGKVVLLVAAAGALVAAMSQAALVLSAEVRYGLFDTDYVGWAVLLPPALVSLTSGLAATLVTSGAARNVSLAVGWGSLLLLGLLALDSAPGMLDGISPSGWAAGAAFALAGVFALVALGLLTRSSVAARRPA
ncbi:hypothetical protein BH24CHL6_BH24CHL6_10750 [soil metagenome]